MVTYAGFLDSEVQAVTALIPDQFQISIIPNTVVLDMKIKDELPVLHRWKVEGLPIVGGRLFVAKIGDNLVPLFTFNDGVSTRTFHRRKVKFFTVRQENKPI